MEQHAHDRSTVSLKSVLVWGGIVALMAGPALVAAAPPAAESKVPDFLHQFVYGLVILDEGKAFLVDHQGKMAATPLATGTRIKTGSVVGTAADAGAVLRLGSGSLLRMAPNTRVRVLPYSLELQEGACRARHVNQYHPLKIEGKATILLTREGAADLETRGNKVLVQVQAGKVRAAGLKEPVAAGQTIEAKGQEARLTDERPAWEARMAGPARSAVDEVSELAEAFDAGSAADLSVLEQESAAGSHRDAEPSVTALPPPANPPPVSPPEPVSPPGAGNSGVVEGEDWMKNPIPVGGGD
ncbi:MAG: hypothetical protein OZSIB_1126 [Candidatus Ozemobacter sibiricus]|jgi:hypothetical protein|uniref:FecR protein domain-containing protein n=1 Tax=Candidatus Ozemobacter sibiricus TaxID=2268124 RepID=A0A367ZL03_9BACT|nr:MAG: hypothetical protein OZSIB_1126 [Candidatus Ozemobacter sibiricus]